MGSEERERDGMPLTLDFRESGKVPYFLWDRSITVAQLRSTLTNRGARDRVGLMAVILREARPDEVWEFVSPQEVAAEWPRLAPLLGRKREFWTWVLEKWRELGLLRP